MKDFTKGSTAAGKLFDRLSSQDEQSRQPSDVAPVENTHDARDGRDTHDTYDTHNTYYTHDTHNTHDTQKPIPRMPGVEIKSRRVSLLLTPSLHAAASEQAYRERKSLNELICDLLTGYVEHQGKE